MRKLILIVLLILITATPVMASDMDFTAPAVPEAGKDLLPYEPETFSEGLQLILNEALPLIHPAFSEAAEACLYTAGIILLLSLVEIFSAKTSGIVRMIGALAISASLLNVSHAMIPLGQETVQELSNYGKLLLPVMTAALAAQGCAVTSGTLYAGTAFFDTILSNILIHVLIPGIYAFLALSISVCALGEGSLGKMKDTVKSVVTWMLKTFLYLFTGYMTITGAVSGSADAMAIKATKVTISGVVPVVGGILSDASEAVLVSAGIMKNAAGIYGVLAILAVIVGPFIRLGAQYILLKLTAALCAMFGSKQLCGLISDFSTAMGLILAMTAAVGIMLVISTVCFMKVVG